MGNNNKICGVAGNRTRVQITTGYALYMLSLLLVFLQKRGKQTNPLFYIVPKVLPLCRNITVVSLVER